MLKKMLLTILIISTFTLNYSFANANDYENHWAKNEINKFIENNFINLRNDKFRPDDFITRGEFVRLVNNVYGYSQKTSKPFKDLKPSDEFFSDILIAKNIGYISGYPDNTFRANKYITRQETAKIFFKIMNLEKYKTNLLSQFKDFEIIPKWSKSYLNKTVDKKYLTGYPDKTLRPKNNITRAEAVKMVDNVIGNIFYNIDENSNKIINNNLVITRPNIKLNNYIIKGDLIVTAKVNNGDFILKNSKVNGDTLILGGGENSIHLINSILNKITLNKANDKIRLLIDKTSQINNISLNSGGTIDSESEGLVNLEINSIDKDIKLLGKFKKIIVNEKNNINLSEDTLINEISLNNKSEINGKGIIEHIIANISGSKINVKTKKISLNNDSKIILNNKEINKDYKEVKEKTDNDRDNSTSNKNGTFKFTIKETFIGSPTFNFKSTLNCNLIKGFDLIYNDLVIASDKDNDGLIRTLNIYKDIDNLVIKYNDHFYKNNSRLNNSDQTSNLNVGFYKNITFKDAPTFDLKVSLNNNYIKGYDLLYNNEVVAKDKDYDGIVRTINLYNDIDKLKVIKDGKVYIDSNNMFNDLK